MILEDADEYQDIARCFLPRDNYQTRRAQKPKGTP
jgi:hypothetical protein